MTVETILTEISRGRRKGMSEDMPTSRPGDARVTTGQAVSPIEPELLAFVKALARDLARADAASAIRETGSDGPQAETSARQGARSQGGQP